MATLDEELAHIDLWQRLIVFMLSNMIQCITHDGFVIEEESRVPPLVDPDPSFGVSGGQIPAYHGTASRKRRGANACTFTDEPPAGAVWSV